MPQPTTKQNWVHVLLKGERVAGQDELELNESDSYVSHFKAKSLDALCVPILEFDLKNLASLAHIIEEAVEQRNHGTGPDVGLVVTSPRVVGALERALETNAALLKELDGELVFVVGQRTGAECSSKLGINWNKMSEQSGNSATLSEVIRTTSLCRAKPMKLIYPKSSLADNTIEDDLASQKNVAIESMVVYETRGLKDVDKCLIDELSKFMDARARIETRLVLNFVFFSPSGVDCFFGMDLQEMLTHLIDKNATLEDIETKFSCIGRTTEAALRRHGVDVFCVASKPSAESLVDNILLARAR